MSIFDIDQATFDQWRESGRFVLFGEASRCECLNGLHEQGRCAAAWPEVPGDRQYPPAAFVEATQPCEPCDGTGYHPHHRMEWHDIDCSDCTNGKRRHPVTVPCVHQGSDYLTNLHDGTKRIVCCNLCKSASPLGRITVAHATVEWGPLPVVSYSQLYDPVPSHLMVPSVVVSLRGSLLWDGERFGQTTDLTLPPDVDPATLIGQWAIGGTIEATP